LSHRFDHRKIGLPKELAADSTARYFANHE